MNPAGLAGAGAIVMRPGGAGSGGDGVGEHEWGTGLEGSNAVELPSAEGCLEQAGLAAAEQRDFPNIADDEALGDILGSQSAVEAAVIGVLKAGGGIEKADKRGDGVGNQLTRRITSE